MSEMKREEIEDLAVQFATEGFTEEHQMVYDSWVLTAEEEDKRTFTEMIDLCADVSIAGGAQKFGDVQVCPSVKAKLLDRVGANNGSTDANALEDGVKLVRSDEQDWINLPIKGGGAKLLELSARRADGFAVSMIEVKPGSIFPEHDHHGVEMAYILEGDLEADGLLLNAGDFFRADPGTHHGEHVSPSGCRALIITANENYHHKTVKTLGAVQKAYHKIKGVFATSKK